MMLRQRNGDIAMENLRNGDIAMENQRNGEKGT
jgi:hypothetical protein